MSTVLKVKTARIGKFFGKQCKLDEDVTDIFDPLNMIHMNMLDSGSLRLVKVATKTNTRRKAK